MIWIKYLSIAVTCLIGALPYLFDFEKKKRGEAKNAGRRKLNRVGRMYFCLLIAGGVVAIATQAIADGAAEEETRELKADNRKLLDDIQKLKTEVEKLAFPATTFNLYYAIRVKLTPAEAKAFGDLSKIKKLEDLGSLGHAVSRIRMGAAIGRKVLEGDIFTREIEVYTTNPVGTIAEKANNDIQLDRRVESDGVYLRIIVMNKVAETVTQGSRLSNLKALVGENVTLRMIGIAPSISSRVSVELVYLHHTREGKIIPLMFDKRDSVVGQDPATATAYVEDKSEIPPVDDWKKQSIAPPSPK